MKHDKRLGYFSWDDTFMNMAIVIAQRSKDPNTQNGACVVNNNNLIIGVGYNGFPRGCHDDDLPWEREGDFCNNKYAYVVHAEENALLNANSDTNGSKIYCTLFPCNECTKVIIQKGVKEVIYDSDKYHDSDICQASRKMLDMAGIKYRQFTPKKKIEFVGHE
ncbi:cytidine deaminase [Candidatus Falkowbacteria bacterium RIFOXYB2_FULL_34_18]|uniref:Cytidine deaminase n=1 Tax=Candidatus Falkowbacteria bacterium RIFOXYD2_FULL_34_120 TaxID=1798007 RepID=A0A1F5TSG3_9BACT|nr:MAG: cytidine deaminase [Candidatus Falkowbacteria bacterium RIFOXYB2_FULL_34_18]OGF29695.1 MAG: cytidine deaminase [Candidatus Falkowbacteria bacterium RIFOXYC12_FULL_34_55]OGF37440.1 MAG: cytidine deaminase [Candidatus Falkowbacteria bacterium RIFOXYC2_FULL_34_220]OGF39165.1 MAG: cytidine deaminase [Candidatus Falkowbacteria bacterium RIFOXYD12_FULL_34_57]OGF41714.1 MAG: cytidine deaminase [Candidatus Falkowbacteria bacterium RIFOXYD2_FULL_34_120]